MDDEEESHELSVISNHENIICLECSCGWGLNRPGEFFERYAPWRVREIVNLSNSHLTAATS